MSKGASTHLEIAKLRLSLIQMKVNISGISYYLPEKVEGLNDLQHDNPDWDMRKILEKTGIRTRHIAASDQTASDLAYIAAEKLLSEIKPQYQIDLLILVTQSPDYLLPTSACILQNRLRLSQNCMAFDVNLGCSGFVTALSIAGGLIETGVVNTGLILCADTYSKYINKHDRACRPIFSDGAAAILVEKSALDCIGPFAFGTDGSGFEHLIVRQGGARETINPSDQRNPTLAMNGSDVFLFTMRVVPACIHNLLDRTELSIDQIDLFIFHQASKLVIDNIIRLMSLDVDKVFVNHEFIGNTVSATIPIALKDAVANGRLNPGQTVLLIGFRVGLSWSGVLLRWSA